MTVAYDAPSTRCLGPRDAPGTVALRDECLSLFEGSYNLGTCACRNVGGTASPSCHRECRAWDAGFKMPGPGRRNPLGDELAWFLVDQHDLLSIQVVIWNKRIWSVTKPYWRTYGGQSDHLDHVHAEQNWHGAKKCTRATVRLAFQRWLGVVPQPEPEPAVQPAPRRRMEVDELERPARKRPELVNGHDCWDTEALAHGTKWNLEGVESVVHSVLCVRPVKPNPEANVTIYWPNEVIRVTVPWGGARWPVAAAGAIAVVDEADVGLNVHVEQIVLPR